MVTVNPEQMKIWEAVTTLCDIPPHDTWVYVAPFNVCVIFNCLLLLLLISLTSVYSLFNNSEWAINIDSVRVSMIQLGHSMKENGWVEAWLMNCFCRKLFRDNHPRKTNKHFFFNTTSVSLFFYFFICFLISIHI